jgi:carboxyvinyl-carboxyphosphonate phosphorylmutase
MLRRAKAGRKRSCSNNRLERDDNSKRSHPVLFGITTKEQLEAAAAQLRIPIILGGGGTLGDRAYLASKGVRVSLQGHQPFQAAVRAIYDTLKALRDGTAPADLKNLASKELMDR